MASTFWAVLYFRSLNPNNVFNQLTKYLLQYQRVSLPSVGTIRLVQQPAQFNVVDKLILPPSFTAEVSEEEKVPEHQLVYLAAALREDKDKVRQQLTELGERLQNQFRGEGFHWKGIGVIRYGGQTTPSVPAALVPINANRVIRPNAEHQVLVGDQQMTSTQMAGLQDGEAVTKNKRSVWMIVAWVLLILSLLYIVFVLYVGKFRMGATGSKQAPTSYEFNLDEKKADHFFLS